MTLRRLPSTSTSDAIVQALQADGALIVENVMPEEQLLVMNDEVRPFIDRTPMGRDDFTGKLTQRTGALIARTPTCRDLVMHPLILDAARSFLAPYTDKIILHLTQTICINPGNPAQPLHRDRLAWGTHIPPTIEPQFNTIWALTDFTGENGATRCVPGSHRWDWEKRADKDAIEQADMKAGSVFVYSGSVLHSGGENKADERRVGLNLTYTLGWLRQEENQYLSCPPHIAKHLDPELQELLGYTQGHYALGYYSDPQGDVTGSDILPPEFALGRSPRKGSVSLSSTSEETLDFSSTEQL
jgi:ectoine hydroxylase-related dioxygenase (phytanoyl-CoA dioxygenase family)